MPRSLIQRPWSMLLSSCQKLGSPVCCSLRKYCQKNLESYWKIFHPWNIDIFRITAIVCYLIRDISQPYHNNAEAARITFRKLEISVPGIHCCLKLHVLLKTRKRAILMEVGLPRGRPGPDPCKPILFCAPLDMSAALRSTCSFFASKFICDRSVSVVVVTCIK